jgi:membrane-associated phospholipid phosphatase
MPIRPRTAALGAGVCAALLTVVWFAAFHIGLFRHADQSIYLQFGALHAHGRVELLAGHLVSLFNPNPYVYLVVALLAIALVRGRPRVAFAVGVTILGANVTTELLKHLVAAPRPGSLFPAGTSPLPPASWPSGHSTAAMSLMLAAVLTVPARLRPAAAAIGAVCAIAVGYSVLATGMHYPSDVLGGFLVAAGWTLSTVAALLAAERWRPSSAGQSSPSQASPGRVSIRAALGAPSAVLLAALLLTAIVAIIRPHDVVDYARAHEAFVIGAAAIGALGLALSTGVLLSVRR